MHDKYRLDREQLRNQVQYTDDEIGEGVDHFTTWANTPSLSGKVSSIKPCSYMGFSG